MRAGGLARPAGLPEPLPRREAAAFVGEWLVAVTELAGGIAVDDAAATWLHALRLLELGRLLVARLPGKGCERIVAGRCRRPAAPA
ncbi:hypothetical protein [Streptomyces sp. SCL15-6]|uniref:hypothetical protein n=1 Tax=Streptomyces sp. SCL15-6 TaxID=2967222 RepID=UPI0029675508|nr:hypothetical protein [Streptomyces sp. SCL15-6]